MVCFQIDMTATVREGLISRSASLEMTGSGSSGVQEGLTFYPETEMPFTQHHNVRLLFPHTCSISFFLKCTKDFNIYYSNFLISLRSTCASPPPAPRPHTHPS